MTMIMKTCPLCGSNLGWDSKESLRFLQSGMDVPDHDCQSTAGHKLYSERVNQYIVPTNYNPLHLSLSVEDYKMNGYYKW